MKKRTHEIRDPIHTFIRLDSEERKVLNARPLQRLRHIHQLGLSYLVYPSATHKRFEHSLGVMELASRVFDVVTRPENIRHDPVRELLPDKDGLRYWRRVLRMAALCHDVGHLPFSHAAEADLLPEGWDHERLTAEIIRSDEMEAFWRKMTPPLRSLDVIKLAVGPKKMAQYAKAGVFGEDEATFDDWATILAEIIVGDAFGVDRMDYLLRDSHHAGVTYGRFDHYRLIDTLRILPAEHEESKEPALGVEEGGLYSAEALLLARYFMYTQVYFHPVRRIYDIHLKDFLSAWLPNGRFSTEIKDHLSITDNEITAAIMQVSVKDKHACHQHARRIMERRHYRLIYQRNPRDVAVNNDAAEAVYQAACGEFGADSFRRDSYRQKGTGGIDFPVLASDARVVSSLEMSKTLNHLPVVAVDFVFADPDIREEVKRWLGQGRNKIITPTEKEEPDE